MKSSLILLSLICTLISACEYHCTNTSPNIAFVAFPEDQTDTIVVKRFTKGSNFSNLIDSRQIDKFNSSFQKINDTLTVWIAYGLEVGFVSRYDYEFTLPSTGRQFRISDIDEPQRTLKKGLFSTTKEGCINSINSYRVNDQLTTGEYISTFYIKR